MLIRIIQKVFRLCQSQHVQTPHRPQSDRGHFLFIAQNLFTDLNGFLVMSQPLFGKHTQPLTGKPCIRMAQEHFRIFGRVFKN